MGVNKEDLLSRNRTNDVVRAKVLFVFIAKIEGHSYSSIGRALDKDHTTIMHLFSSFKGKEWLPPLLEKFKDEPKYSSQTTKFRGRYASVYERTGGVCSVCGFEEAVVIHQDGENTTTLCPNHKILVDKGLMILKDIQ